MIKITIIKPAVKKESKVAHRDGLKPSKDGFIMSTSLCAFIKKFCHKGNAIKSNLYCTLLQEVA